MNIDAAEKPKHLRFVHFTLVTVCAALLNITLLSEDSTLFQAVKQYDEVRASIKDWKEDWLTRNTEPQIKAALPDPPVPVLLGIKNSEGKELTFSYSLVENSTHSDIKFSQAGLSNLFSIGSIPESLHEFHGLWDTSLVPYDVLTVASLGPNGAVAYVTDPVEVGTATVTPLSEPPDNPLLIRRGLNPLTKDEIGNPQSNFPSGYKITSFNKPKSVNLDKGIIYVQFEAQTKPFLKIDPFPYLIQTLELDSETTRAPFGFVFRDLDKMTEGVQHASWETLDTIVAGWKKQVSKEPSINLFGITASANMLTTAGGLITLLLQLYFALHLLAAKTDEIPSWYGFPWIALYPSSLARYTFLASSSILPPFVIAVLTGKRFFYEFAFGVNLDWGARLELGIGIMAFACSSWLAVQCIRCYHTWPEYSDAKPDEQNAGEDQEG